MVLLGGSIILKILLILVSYEIVEKYYYGSLKLTYSWLLSYLFMLGGMLLLSPFNGVTSKNLIVYIVVVILIFGSIFRKKQFNFDINVRITNGKKIWNFIAIFTIISIIALLACHNVVYYDTTDDALVQGMPKLAYIQQHKTLFVRYNTATINTFSNEWFGEINGLFYLILTGRDNFVLFGNVEILIFIFIALVEIIDTISKKQEKYTWLLAGYILSTPVVLGLSMTIKTDLASLIMVAIMIVTIHEYMKVKSEFLLIASIATIGAVAATKVTVIPIAGLFAISIIIYYFRNIERKKIVDVILGIFIAGIFCSRYVINLFEYHNPFQRALNEKAVFSVFNCVDNVRGIVGKFFETKSLIETIPSWSSNNWVLTKGMGYGGEIIALLIVIGVFLNLKYLIKRQNVWYFLIPYVGSALFVLMGTLWYDWSFRYFYPYILPVEIWAIIYISDRLKRKKRIYRFFSEMGCFFICVIMILNGCNAFRMGQAIPDTVDNVIKMPKTEQKLLYSCFIKYDDLNEIPGFMQILENGGKGIVLDEFSSPYYELFGDDNCVFIDLVADETELLNHYNDSSYDFIAISSLDYDSDMYISFETEMKNNGYVKYVGSYGAIFIK